MPYTLTTDFQSIQERHIDPYSPVDSDNTSKILMALCKDKCVACGFNLSLVEDDTSVPPDGVPDRVVAVISPGKAVKDYIAIAFYDNVYLELFSIGEPIHAGNFKYIVLEYVYQKVQPQPFATIRVITPMEYDSSKHLVPYKIRFEYDAGVNPIDLNAITIFDQRFVEINNPFRFETIVYVGGMNSGSLAMSSGYTREYFQVTDVDLGNINIYPEAYFDDNGVITIATNSPFIGHHFVVTVLDLPTTSYETSQFYVYSDPFTYTVSHGLNNTYNIVGVFLYIPFLNRWAIVEPETVYYNNQNTTTVSITGMTGTYGFIKSYVPDYEVNVMPSATNPSIIVHHGLYHQYPIVQVVDLNTNNLVIPEDIHYIDGSRLEVSFGPSAYGTPYKILVKYGNEYDITISDSHEFIIHHNLHKKYLDFVRTASLDDDFMYQLEWVQFLDDNRLKVKFGDSVTGWFNLSMGFVGRNRGCV